MIKRIILNLIKFIDTFYIRKPFILYYHGIIDIKNKNNPSPDLVFFESQMQLLVKREFNFVSLKDIQLWITGEIELPPKSVAITFDDGLSNNYLNVYNILKKYNIKATIFLISNFIGSSINYTYNKNKPQFILKNNFNPQRDIKMEFLTIQQIKEMYSSGLIEFGSHTLTHPSLSHIISETILINEISKSKEELENLLNIPIETFCYPYGHFNETVKMIVEKSGYICATSTKKGSVNLNDDLFELKRRVEINLLINMPPVIRKLGKLYEKV